jgi:NCS1 family nucleobase:cation symporter-1
MTRTPASETGIELHHVDPVPESHRRGRPRDLFHVWFASNLNVGNAIFGAIIYSVCRSIPLALLAAVIGNLVGTVLMALHSIQGARLGIPQLIQSRGQFGYLGALVPVVVGSVMYVGFTVSVSLAGGIALKVATDGRVPLPLATTLVAALSVVPALMGNRAIHVVARCATWPLTVSLILVSAYTLVREDGVAVTSGPVSLTSFLAGTGVAVTFALSYATAVSDYSRYLPSDASGRAVFWWTAAGVFLSSTFCCVIGVLLAARFAAADVFQSASAALGGGALATVVLVVTALGLAVTNMLNLYGGMLNLITGLSTFVKIPNSFRTRAAMMLPTLVIGVGLAVTASQDFTGNLTAFLSFLLLLLIPWGAVNLVDFYLVQHGEYDVPGMYTRSGKYWSDPPTWTHYGVNLKVLIAFLTGVVSGIPAMSNGWYVGPVARQLDNADLSWIPGMVVTSVVYLALVHVGRATRGEPSTAAARPHGTPPR